MAEIVQREKVVFRPSIPSSRDISGLPDGTELCSTRPSTTHLTRLRFLASAETCFSKNGALEARTGHWGHRGSDFVCSAMEETSARGRDRVPYRAGEDLSAVPGHDSELV